MSSRHKVNDGDWICSDPKCANVNFARRTCCNRCNKDKVTIDSKSKKQGTEIGKAAAEKSHGLFSADDWQCSKCGNVNWARRSTCNLCNAPKLGETEERTGYGGGFNEREGVEYVRREDSDDEYDAFGRLKKSRKKDGVVNQKSVSSFQKRDTEKYTDRSEDEEDDEDDDEEDGDLSKYQLFDDEDEEDLAHKGSPSASKSSPKHSLSTSHSSSSSSSSDSESSYSSRSSSSSRSRRNRSRSSQRNDRFDRSDYRKRSHSRSRSRERKYSRK